MTQTMTITTEVLQPGDKIIDVGMGRPRLYTVERQVTPTREWESVSHAGRLMQGDRMRATAPDGSGIVEEFITRGPDRSDMTLMHGSRSVRLYFEYGWTVERKVR